MTVARRFQESVQLASIVFAGLHATAGLLLFLSVTPHTLTMLLLFLMFTGVLCGVILTLRLSAIYYFRRWGKNESALFKIRCCVWSMAIFFGLLSITLAWQYAAKIL